MRNSSGKLNCYTLQKQPSEMFNFQKKPFEDVFQNSRSQKFRNIYRKTAILDSLFNKVAGLKVCNFIKKRLRHWYFPVNIAKFLRTPILKNIFKWLLLKIEMNSLRNILLYYLHSLDWCVTLLWFNGFCIRTMGRDRIE